MCYVHCPLYMLYILFIMVFFFFIKIASTLTQNNINYFAVNEVNSPLAILDLLEATMQIYHNYQHHYSGSNKSDTTSFTLGVLLVTVSEDEFSNPYVFPPNRLRPAYSMQGISIVN
jgi:hypothetical protein